MTQTSVAGFDEPEELPRITLGDLAVQSAVTQAQIADLVARGLIREPDQSGTFELGDVSRVRLIAALEKSGLDIATLAACAADRGLSFDFAGSIIADPVGLAAITVGEACAQLATSRATFHALMLAVGVATPADDEPIREDDLELLRILVAVGKIGLSNDALLPLLRAFAINMRRLVEAQRDLFRRHVEEPMLARGMPYHEMFAASAAIRIPLQRRAYRVTALLHRRLLEQLVYENLVTRFEEALDETQATRVRSAAHQAICFVDLSGFTARTESLGDADAASVGSALTEIAQAQSTIHRGSLVKPLGDGAMLRFARPDDAVRGALGVVSGARERQLPPARAGIANGPVIMQDGDYYGRTVNRASRLLGVAQPHQVLVTAEIAEGAHDRLVRFTDVGVVRLRGVAEEVRAFAAAMG